MAMEKEASESKRSPFAQWNLLTWLLGLCSHQSGFKAAAGLQEMRQKEVGSWLGGVRCCRLLVGVPWGPLDSVSPPIWSASQLVADVPEDYVDARDICRYPASGHLSAEKSPLEGLFCQGCKSKWGYTQAGGWVAGVAFRWQHGVHCRLCSAGPANTDVFSLC